MDKPRAKRATAVGRGIGWGMTSNGVRGGGKLKICAWCSDVRQMLHLSQECSLMNVELLMKREKKLQSEDGEGALYHKTAKLSDGPESSSPMIQMA